MLCVLGDAYEKKTTRLADGSIIYDKHHFTEPIPDTRFWIRFCMKKIERKIKSAQKQISYILIISIVFLWPWHLHCTGAYHESTNFGKFSLKWLNWNFWSNHLRPYLLVLQIRCLGHFKFSLLLKMNFNHNKKKNVQMQYIDFQIV